MRPDWWQRGVVYQVYPRSFADSDGNGVGDLPGIEAHLDHLVRLGVDAIWLSPIYPSPGLDLGYDVADHAAIDPLFGTMDDFDRLVAEAHGRGLGIVLDLVLNHTSDVHRWFVDSRRGRTGEHADWYLWADPAGFRRGRPLPPNNWASLFGGPAWEWVPERGQFYMHTFLRQQPELNFRNPAVREAQLRMVRGWLDRGVDGFRLDVFNAFFKDPHLGSNPPRRPLPRGLSRFRGWNQQLHINDKDQPELDDFLREFRAIVDEVPGRMTVGELFDGTPLMAATHTAPGHLIFDFKLVEQPWVASALAGRSTSARRPSARIAGRPSSCPTTTSRATPPGSPRVRSGRGGEGRRGPPADPARDTVPVLRRGDRHGRHPRPAVRDRRPSGAPLLAPPAVVEPRSVPGADALDRRPERWLHDRQAMAPPDPRLPDPERGRADDRSGDPCSPVPSFNVGRLPGYAASAPDRRVPLGHPSP